MKTRTFAKNSWNHGVFYVKRHFSLSQFCLYFVRGGLWQVVFAVSSYLEVCYDYSGVTCNTYSRYITFTLKAEISEKTSSLINRKHVVDSFWGRIFDAHTIYLFFALKGEKAKKNQMRFFGIIYFVLFTIFNLPFTNSDNLQITKVVCVFIFITWYKWTHGLWSKHDFH